MAAGRIIEIRVIMSDESAVAKLKALGLQSDATAAQMSRGFKRTGAGIRSIGTALERTGRMMTGVGLGMAAFGYVAVKSAVTFQTAMERIHTQAGSSQRDVDALTKAVLKLGGSGQVQYGPTDLANALYHIKSVAVGTYPALSKTSVAMNVLRVAAEGAAIGGTSLEDTSTALMGVMFAIRAPVSKAAQVMEMINSTVGAGNLRMSDLTLALGRGVIPAFKQIGLTATDAFAAIALLSDSGVKASSAAAQMGTALHYLVKPSTEADKFLTALHMSSTSMAYDLHQPRGLLVALTDLRTHLQKYAGGLHSVAASEVVSSIFPGGRGRILLTLLQNLDRYSGKLDVIYNKQQKLHEAAQAQAHTLGGQLHIAWAKISTDLTKFGTTLIPIISKYLPPFLHDIEGILKWFTQLSPATKSFLTKLAAGLLIFGPMIWFLGKTVKLYIALRDAFLFIKGAGIAAAVGEGAATGGLVSLAAALDFARLSAVLLLKTMLPLIAAYEAFQQLKGVGSDIQKGKVGKAAEHGGIGGALLGGVIGFVGSGFDPAGAVVGAVAGGAGGAGAGGLSAVIFGPGGVLGGKSSKIPRGGSGRGHLPTSGAQGGLVTSGGIQRFQYGGPVGMDNVPAWLSQGEGVLNRTAMSGIGAQGLGMLNSGMIMPGGQAEPIEITVNSILDGRLVAKAVLRATLNKAARGSSSLVGGALTTGARSVGPG